MHAGPQCQDGWPACEEGNRDSFAEDARTALASVWATCVDGGNHGSATSEPEKFWVCSPLGLACVEGRCSCVLAGASSEFSWWTQRRDRGGVNRELRSLCNAGIMYAILTGAIGLQFLVWCKVPLFGTIVNNVCRQESTFPGQRNASPVRVKATVREGHGKLSQPNINVPNTTVQKFFSWKFHVAWHHYRWKISCAKKIICSSQRFAGRSIRLRGSTQ